MKTYFQIIIYIFGLAAQAQSAFDRGNAFYGQEKYAEAAAAYESVIASGKQSPELYFNLANAYYKQNKVAPAILNYEKALVLKPNDREIQDNLRFAQKLTIDEIKEMPKVGFSKMLSDLTATFTYDGWAWLSVALAFAFLLVFAGYYFAASALIKRISFVAMGVLVMAIAGTMMSAFAARNNYLTERPAVVFSEAAEVHSEPRATASSVFVLHEGTTVMVREQLHDWLRIELLDGSDGWIQQNAIKEVKQFNDTASLAANQQ